MQLKEGGSGLNGVPVRFIPPDFGPGGFFAGSNVGVTDTSAWFDIVSLAKRLEEVFLPDRKRPVVLPDESVAA